MTREIIDFVSPEVEAAFYERNGLSSHVVKLRGQNKGTSRWLALAVVTGAVVALAVVRFLIR
ncbi:MAG: hypothetical protein WB780_09525 [Candidatus Acidiferrales bacterium]